MLITTTGQSPRTQPNPHVYQVYGLLVRSYLPLPCQLETRPGCIDMELVRSPVSLDNPSIQRRLRQTDADDWFRSAVMDDGSIYLRWPKLGEFLISPDGRRIICHSLNGITQETFQTYLVTQAVSCALVKQGVEPLHATVAVVNNEAVAFLGDCGYGKSSLGAAFLRTGHTLLTDDLLVVGRQPDSSRRFIAYPGPPRIKLFPRIARIVLGNLRAGTPMNPKTSKLVIPLTPHESCTTPVPIKAMYVLRPPAPGRASNRIAIRTISPRCACLELIANTFNIIITDPARLARQFHWAAQLAAAVPVKSLFYPRSLGHIPAVLAAIRKDLAR